MSPHLRWIFQHTGNTAPACDHLQYWMLWEMDGEGLDVVSEIVNCRIRGERLEAVAHGGLNLLRKKPPHGIKANDRPLLNLVLLRKVVGLVVIVVLYGPDALTLSVGAPGDDAPHSASRV